VLIVMNTVESLFLIELALSFGASVSIVTEDKNLEKEAARMGAAVLPLENLNKLDEVNSEDRS